MMGLGNFVNFLKFDWETIKKSGYAILNGHLPFRTGNSNPPFDYLMSLQAFSFEECISIFSYGIFLVDWFDRFETYLETDEFYLNEIAF